VPRGVEIAPHSPPSYTLRNNIQVLSIFSIYITSRVTIPWKSPNKFIPALLGLYIMMSERQFRYQFLVCILQLCVAPLIHHLFHYHNIVKGHSQRNYLPRTSFPYSSHSSASGVVLFPRFNLSPRNTSTTLPALSAISNPSHTFPCRP
jgi:hypothetical protein